METINFKHFVDGKEKPKNIKSDAPNWNTIEQTVNAKLNEFRLVNEINKVNGYIEIHYKSNNGYSYKVSKEINDELSNKIKQVMETAIEGQSSKRPYQD